MSRRIVKKIGFMGLGRMGTHMANNIHKAGFDLVIHNRSKEKMQAFVEKGVRAADTPRGAATDVDVVITCLMDDQSMLDNVMGEDGILAGLKPGGIHIGTATISPSCARKLSELHQAHGSDYVSAPIFGRPDAAEAGTLLSYISGNPEAISACENLFNAYTGKHINMGEDPGVVNSIKLAMNFMLVALVELYAEVYTFAEKSGIDLEFTEGLIHTVLAHPVMHEYTTRIRIREFEPAAFALSAGFKDVELMLQASSHVQAPLPIAGMARDKFLTALANGMAEKDWSAVSEIARGQAAL